MSVRPGGTKDGLGSVLLAGLAAGGDGPLSFVPAGRYEIKAG